MAGAGYKLFNTGDVLTAAQVNTYLQEQVVMVFNDATARTTALSGVLAEGMVSYLKSTKVVEIYNGTAWASLDDPNAIQNTIVDAKGDLISASGNDVPARLAVGNNGETLVADSSTSTGLRWSAGNPQGNPVINSAYQIWQRGTSFSVALNTTTYTADRWVVRRGNAGETVSRQTTADTTNLPFIQYCARVQRDSGNTTTSPINISQSLETVNSIPYAGKTVTISYYARRGANYSGASNTLNVDVYTGTGTDENVALGYTGSALTFSAPATLTTTWQRFTASGTIPTTATEIGIYVNYTPVGTAGAADFFEITGVQLDVGSVALPFRTYAATLAGELQACMRYYQRINSADALYAQMSVFSPAGSTTKIDFAVQPFVPMRVTPTSLEYSTLTISDNAALTAATGTFALTTSNSRFGINFSYTHGTAVFTQYRNYCILANNSLTAYLGFSAEL